MGLLFYWGYLLRGLSIHRVAAVTDSILLRLFVLLKINTCCLLKKFSDAVPTILRRFWSPFGWGLKKWFVNWAFQIRIWLVRWDNRRVLDQSTGFPKECQTWILKFLPFVGGPGPWILQVMGWLAASVRWWGLATCTKWLSWSWSCLMDSVGDFTCHCYWTLVLNLVRAKLARDRLLS